MKSDFEIFDEAYANSPSGPNEERETFALKTVRAYILANDPEVAKMREAVKNLQEVWDRNYGRYHEIMGNNPRFQSLDEAMGKIDAAFQNKTNN